VPDFVSPGHTTEQKVITHKYQFNNKAEVKVKSSNSKNRAEQSKRDPGKVWGRET